MDILSKLTGSRVWHELVKIFSDKAPKECLHRMQKLKILPQIHPSLLKFNFSLFHEAIQVNQLYNLLVGSTINNNNKNVKGPLNETITLWKFYLLVIMDNLRSMFGFVD